MVAEYFNRKGEAHYLKAIPTKNGKERYYIVKDRSKYPDSQLLSDVPSGFEFYEFPEDARVALRKRIKSIVTSEEIQTVQEVMAEHETVKDFILERSKDSVFVYVAHLNMEEWEFDPELFRKVQSYWPKLKFQKSRNGTYEAQRFCQLSRYYGWITMETSDDLYALAEKYCYHIDKESLLDFWIEGEEDF